MKQLHTRMPALVKFNRSIKTLSRMCAVVASFALSAQAAVPVEESVGPISSASADSVMRTAQTIENTPAAVPSDSSLSGLFYQLQVLQQEVQDLRGQLEEQQYLLQRLQRGQQDQYLDLDKRLAALATGHPQPAPQTASSTGVTTAPETLQGESITERDAYALAIENMRARQFDMSIQGFRQLITDFPNGQYTPNAFYWLGELYLAQKQREQSRQNFMQVLNLYPDHQKVPDALYKLGVVYQGLGDEDKALEYLQRVQTDYSQSPAAALAKKYAEVMVKGAE